MTRARTVPRTGSGEVESIEVHHLVPRGDEVAHELLLRVVARVDLRDCTELGVRAEDEVDATACPLQLARQAVAAHERLLGFGRRLPRRRPVAPAPHDGAGR